MMRGKDGFESMIKGAIGRRLPAAVRLKHLYATL